MRFGALRVERALACYEGCACMLIVVGDRSVSGYANSGCDWADNAFVAFAQEIGQPFGEAVWSQLLILAPNQVITRG